MQVTQGRVWWKGCGGLFSCLLALGVFAGCGGGGSGSHSTDSGQTQVALTIKVPEPSRKVSQAPASYAIRRVSLTIAEVGGGAPLLSRDITPLSSGREDIETVVLPTGRQYVFEARAYDGVGLAFVGSTTEGLPDGRQRDVFIILEPVPRIHSVSLIEGVEGDTLKIVGADFGATQEESVLTIGGVEASVLFDRGTNKHRDGWSDTVIFALIPPGVDLGEAPIEIAVGGRASSRENPVRTITILDRIYGVGGEMGAGNLDRFILPIGAPTTVQVNDVSGTDSGSSSSVAISSNGEVVAEADMASGKAGERGLSFKTAGTVSDRPVPSGRDVALSQNGDVALVADATATLRLLTGFSSGTPVPAGVVNPLGDCVIEVALSADGDTVAAIGQSPCGTGLFRLLRIEGLLSGNPTFTPLFSSAAGEAYTDVAMSADAEVVVIGRHQAGGAGIYRVRNFTTAPDLISDEAVLDFLTAISGKRVDPTPAIDQVDVDLSADGMTALADLSDTDLAGTPASDPEHYIFQILDADLPAVSVVAQPINTCFPSPTDPLLLDCTLALSGTALNSGGSIALVKIPSVAGLAQPRSLIRSNGFNQINPSPAQPQFTTPPLPNDGFIRSQDQLDLQ